MSQLTDEQQSWIEKAKRDEVNGWIYLRVGGEPFERGFQHGYLTVDEFRECIRVYTGTTYLQFGMEYSFFVETAAKMHKSLLDAELLAEMEGLAAGFTAGGFPTTLDDIIGWNAWMELTDYWWPTVASKHAKDGPKKAQNMHCSAFIAVGSYTADGKVAMGHESFDMFAYGQFFNLALDLTPAKGHRMVMQSVPGYVGSFTDFWVTAGGLCITETTMGGFKGYDPKKIPEYARSRYASQYANNIDEWVQLVRKGDNGGYANTWLIADVKNQEIARYEEGLIYTNLERTKDGYYFGDNGPNDPRIQHLEASPVGYTDIRSSVGARRVRWRQLLEQHKGEIDAEMGKRFLADDYDVFLGVRAPGPRNICARNDSDKGAVPGGAAPGAPFGSCDGKVASSDDIAAMRFWGRIGRADGAPFYVEEYLRENPQWDQWGPYLQDRPHQPWTLFDNGTTQTQIVE